MSRGLIRGVLAALFAASALASARAARPVDRSGPSELLERFLALPDPTPVEYRALRHLEAQNVPIECERAVEIGYGQMHVADAGLGVNRHGSFRLSALSADS